MNTLDRVFTSTIFSSPTVFKDKEDIKEGEKEDKPQGNEKKKNLSGNDDIIVDSEEKHRKALSFAKIWGIIRNFKFQRTRGKLSPPKRKFPYLLGFQISK